MDRYPFVWNFLSKTLMTLMENLKSQWIFKIAKIEKIILSIVKLIEDFFTSFGFKPLRNDNRTVMYTLCEEGVGVVQHSKANNYQMCWHSQMCDFVTDLNKNMQFYLLPMLTALIVTQMSKIIKWSREQETRLISSVKTNTFNWFPDQFVDVENPSSLVIAQ